MIAACPSLEQLEEFARHRAEYGEPDALGSRSGALPDWLAGHLSNCPRCTSVVEQLTRDNSLLADAAAAVAGHFHPEAGAAVPPGYQFLEEIGRGGQGLVLLALHTASRRRVAIKVLARGRFATSRQRARFEREAELAAGLRHPGIVTLHDCGVTTDGSPYLVMEHVDGRPLDAFAAELAGTDPDPQPRRHALLRVFAQICAAVAHAHARGVIHRDLKPGNILIERGPDHAPRVLDFGLAKSSTADGAGARATIPGEFAGTLAYAAPEVLRRGAEASDARSDVYALGVILYELLAGRRPHDTDGPIADCVRRITEIPAPPLTTIDRNIDADLDTIARRALSIDPEHRYQSVESLGRDVERALAGEPIEARRDSALSLLRRRARRHRAALSLAVLTIMVLAGLSATLVVLYRDATSARALAEKNRDEAQTQHNRAEKLLDISLGIISGDLAEGGDFSRRDSIGDVAELAAERAERELAGDPAARARMYATLARLQSRQGHDEAAQRLARSAMDDAIAAHGERSDAYLSTLHDLNIVLVRSNQRDAAAEIAAQAVELARDLHGPVSEPAAFALVRLGETRLPNADTGLPPLREAVAIYESLPERGPAEYGRALGSLGLAMLRAGDPVGAEASARQSLALRGAGLGTIQPNRFPTRETLARALMAQRRYSEAEEILNDLLKGRLGLKRGRSSAVITTTRRLLAETILRQSPDRLDEAVALATLPDGRLSAAITITIGTILLEASDGHVAAEPLLRQVLEVEDTRQRANSSAVVVRAMLAMCQARRADSEGAAATAVAAVELAGGSTVTAWDRAQALRTAAATLDLIGRPDQAEACRRKLATAAPARDEPEPDPLAAPEP